MGLPNGPLFLLSIVPAPCMLDKMSVLFRYCSCAAVVDATLGAACSAVESSPETEGKLVLTIRPAGLLLPVEGAIGLAELMAGDEEGESFQLEPLP